MILIAPDKFKGTLSAREAASIIASEFKDYFCLMAPMADGGEGTAQALASCNPLEWDEHDGYFVHRPTRIAAIDSSAWIGLNQAKDMGGVMKATSAPLGVKVRQILDGGCKRAIIGVGGTGTCDGGVGFLQALGINKIGSYADKIIGLCDVSVPLVSDIGGLDALSFAPQKGASPRDIPILKRRLRKAQREWGHGRASGFDGAGGGMGFAIASAIGAPCYSGANFVLRNYDIDWSLAEAAITGEGRIDSQTLAGKAVHAVADAATAYDIPTIAIGGCVADGVEAALSIGVSIISAEKFKRADALSHEEAAYRLRLAARRARQWLEEKRQITPDVHSKG